MLGKPVCRSEILSLLAGGGEYQNIHLWKLSDQI